MPMLKIHMRKAWGREGFVTALCSMAKREPKAVLTDNAAAVDCQKCRAAIAFNEQCEADWKRRQAEFKATFPEGGAR